MSDSLKPHGLQPSRFFCPWDFWGKNIGVGCHILLQQMFQTQGSNLCLLLWQTDSLSLSHQGSPTSTNITIKNTRSLCLIYSKTYFFHLIKIFFYNNYHEKYSFCNFCIWFNCSLQFFFFLPYFNTDSDRKNMDCGLMALNSTLEGIWQVLQKVSLVSIASVSILNMRIQSFL